MKRIGNFILFLALVSSQVSFATAKQQPLPSVVGIVSDYSGLIQGATISVIGTSKTSESDCDGMYGIHASKGQILTFKYPGRKDLNVIVGESKIINVTLEMESESNALWISDGKQIINPLTAENCVASSTAVEQLLNRAASLSAKSNTTRVTLSCKRGSMTPPSILLVIDGVIAEKIELIWLTDDEIQNVIYISGPQGAALYGSDGINGVVILETNSHHYATIEAPSPKFKEFTLQMLTFQRETPLNVHLKSLPPSKQIFFQDRIRE